MCIAAAHHRVTGARTNDGLFGNEDSVGRMRERRVGVFDVTRITVVALPFSCYADKKRLRAGTGRSPIGLRDRGINLEIELIVSPTVTAPTTTLKVYLIYPGILSVYTPLGISSCPRP